MSTTLSEAKSEADILLETVEFYGQDFDRRGIKKKTCEYTEYGVTKVKSSQSCQYVVTNGETKYCAVGRCLTDEAKDIAAEVYGTVQDLVHEWWEKIFARNEWNTGGYDDDFDEEGLKSGLSDQTRNENEEYYLDDMLQVNYRGHSVDFWCDIQGLHDGDQNWCQDADNQCWLTMNGYYTAECLAGQHLSAEEVRVVMPRLKAHTKDFIPGGEPYA